MIVESGDVVSDETALLSDKEKQRGYVLACRTRVQGNVHVTIPKETLEKKLQAEGMGKEATDKLFGLVEPGFITPMMKRITLTLDPLP